MDKAADAFTSGRYEEAIKYLHEAYAEDPRPLYLFNIGRACEEMGDDWEAITFFERVQDSDADAALKELASTRITEARARLAAIPVGPELPPGDEKPKTRWVPWVIGAGGVAAAGAGGVLLFLARDLRSSVTNAKTDDQGMVTGMSHEDAYARRDRADVLAGTGTILGAAGAAVAVGAVTWALLDDEKAPDTTPAVEIVPSSGGLSAFFRLSF